MARHHTATGLHAVSNIPGGINYEDRVLSALNKLLGQKDEQNTALKEMFHQQQLHETRTAASFERFGEMFKGINSRISRLEDSVENTAQTRYQSIRVKNEKFHENVLKTVGALLLTALGAATTWIFRK